MFLSMFLLLILRLEKNVYPITLVLEHQSPINKNGKPPDTLNRGTVLLKRRTSVIAWLVHSWFKVTLLLFRVRLYVLWIVKILVLFCLMY